MKILHSLCSESQSSYQWRAQAALALQEESSSGKGVSWDFFFFFCNKAACVFVPEPFPSHFLIIQLLHFNQGELGC